MITDLIKALVVLEPYLGNESYPIHCEKNMLYINVDPSILSDIEIRFLDSLGIKQDPEWLDRLATSIFDSCD